MCATERSHRPLPLGQLPVPLSIHITHAHSAWAVAVQASIDSAAITGIQPHHRLASTEGRCTLIFS